jgi:positive regulator of sigma E activity
MTPSLSVPTDNIYKFACLFGLALILVSAFSFVTTYTTNLDRKVRYSEVVISLDSKSPRSKNEDDLLELNKKLLEVTNSNEKTANIAIGFVFFLGAALSFLGASSWYIKVQQRDDQLVNLQMQKLEAEISKLYVEIEAAKAKIPNTHQENAHTNIDG